MNPNEPGWLAELLRRLTRGPVGLNRLLAFLLAAYIITVVALAYLTLPVVP